MAESTWVSRLKKIFKSRASGTRPPKSDYWSCADCGTFTKGRWLGMTCINCTVRYCNACARSNCLKCGYRLQNDYVGD